MNSQSSIDFSKRSNDLSQHKIIKGPISKLELGKFASQDEKKSNYVSQYNFTMKPINPDPFKRISSLQNSSSIVLDIPGKNQDVRSEARAK